MENSIFDEIAKKLSDAGLDAFETEKRVSAVKQAYSGLPEDKLREKIEQSGGIDSLVEKIIAAGADAPDGEGSAGDPEKEEGVDQAPPQIDISLDDDMFSDDEPGVSTETIADDTAAGADAADAGKPSAAEFFNDDDVKVKQPEKKRPAEAKKPEKGKKALQTAKKETAGRDKRSVRNMSEKAKTTYVVTMIILVPLLILLIAAFTVIVLALYAALILITVASSVGLVILAAGGTALSLMAIIYGVIQIAQGVAAPIGMYEIGLGIIAGGITLGASILLYNFIVRLIPFLFKKLFVFYKFVCRQLTRLLSYVKGVCSKL